MELPALAVGSRRFLAQVVVVLLLASCARSPKPENTRPEAISSNASGTTDAVPFTSSSDSAEIASLPALPSSRILNEGDTQLPELALATSDSATTLTIASATVLPGSAKTQVLTNPNRLVVDFPQAIASRATSRTFENPDSNFTEKVRVAAYQGKTRIVFDLAEGTSVKPTVTSNAGKLAITLSSRTPSIASSSAKLATAPEFASTASVSADAATSAARLSAMRFEKTGAQSNQLVLDMDSAGVYSLKRTAPSEFVLRLEDATLSDAANQAIVASSTDGKIRSVRPLVDGHDVVLRIFSSPNTSLKAESQSGGIVVSAAGFGQELMSDARAQLAPAKTEESKTIIESNKDSATAAAKDITIKNGVVTTTEGKDTVAKNASTAAGDGELNALLEDQQYTGRLISLDLQDTDIDNALRIIAEVSNLNIVTTEDVQGKITLRLIDVPWDQALDVILKINQLGKVQEGNVVRIAPLEKIRAEREALKQAKQAEEQLEELKVRYMRVSYARAADLKPLTETVLSERGSVAYDDRTNQIIIKDTKAGVSRVVELVRKIDLRTPQVLLETQIVESKRGFQRQLGSRFGFKFIQSPSTGNGTGWNFPNSVIGNGVGNNLGQLSESSSPGVLSMLFGSADGTRNLDVTLAAAENEGLAKVISRPSVATTNNKQATIKSVTKLRIKTPSGGTQVAVGQGGQTSGSPVATETIEAGITLDVTPQASPDYYVLLDIHAKSSTFDGTTSIEGVPSEVERSATSTILVSSGQTFVMGGIYKITENNVLNGIPFMKDIPVFGHLFRFSDVNDTDEELLFFITPRIVEGSFDDAAMKAAM